MRSTFIGLVVVNTLVVVSLFVYFPLTWFNLVFTFDDLPSDNVPYYNDASSAYDRYNAMWWILSTDILRWIAPLYCGFTITMLIMEKRSSIFALTAYTVIFIVLFILEVAKAVIFTWQLVYCSDYQLCRNFDTSGNPNTANYVFITIVAYDYWFIVAYIIYMAFSDALRKEAALELGIESFTSNSQEHLITLNIGSNDDSDDGEEDDLDDYLGSKRYKSRIKVRSRDDLMEKGQSHSKSNKKKRKK